MALNKKDPVAERLEATPARPTGDSKSGPGRKARLLRFLEEEAWPSVPKAALGRRVTKKELEAILGY
jgi:hypothetical protein